MTGMVARGQAGRAMFSFLTEIIGLSPARVDELKNAPRSYDALAAPRAARPGAPTGDPRPGR
jgi:hypothetical protein